MSDTKEEAGQTISNADTNDQVNECETNVNRETQEGAGVPDCEGLRRSERASIPTERMAAYKEEEYNKAYSSLHTSYDKWKETARIVKHSLKGECEEQQLGSMLDTLKQRESNLTRKFDNVRQLGPIQPETLRRVDASAAITTDLIKILHERISGIEEYEPEREKQRLRDLHKFDCSHSIFSVSESELSYHTNRSDTSEKVADAAAEMAAKKVEYDCLMEEEEKRIKLMQTESEMKRLEAQRHLRVAQAKYQAYSHAMSIDQQCVNKVKQENSTYVNPVQSNKNDIDNTALDALAQAFANSVQLNRLPVPEPSIFHGDPLQYTEWKTSFQTLIDRKAVPAEEKLFYLKKYTGGPARKALDGFFFSSSKTAYNSARELLEERYGHPFVVQRAFRERLEKWPKIGPRDSIGLRNFADFLQSCRGAMSCVPSLKVLDDCNENQKLMMKLPDWASLRWNRQVTTALETSDYPSFSQFVDFVIKEAKVACNPVSSLFAMNTADKKMPKPNNDKIRVLATASSESTETSNDYRIRLCEFCGKNDHFIVKCNGFLALNIQQKRDFIRKNNLCYGCLRKGHRNQDCKRKHTCGSCKGKHPTCLHEERRIESSKETSSLNPNAPLFSAHSKVTATSSCGLSQIQGRGTSMIVPVWVSHNSDQSNEVLTYALLDTQSDTTFILDELAASLHVPQQPIKLNLSTMTSQNTVVDSFRICDLEVRGFHSAERVAINQTYTRNFIPVDRTHIPQRKTAQIWPHLNEIVDAIPPLQSCEVGLLIGYNCPQALAPRQILMGKQSNDPYAVKTLLGWSIVGCFVEGYDKGICHRIMTREVPPCTPRELIKVFERDFQQEATHNTKCSQEDLQFLDILEKGLTKSEKGHLEMPLPFKQRPILPNNKSHALLRLDHLKRKLKRDEKYNDHYCQFMKGLIERGEAEQVTSDGEPGNVWYIPHHGVYHPQKPNKIRVVFDCSARYGNTSLNQHLLTGPDLTNGLIGVLCRFRKHPVAVMGDIEGMFHQFFVQTKDRDFLRFLWWEGGDILKNPIEYRMKVHLFGAASSPGCANYGFNYLAQSMETKFPAASSFIRRNFYVDDGLTSVETVADAIALINEARTLCEEGGLHLHKFMSNYAEVLNAVPETERAANVKDVNLSLVRLPIERALGVKWCAESDTFKFEVTFKNQPATRRNMLSTVASIFDPIGFLSPFTLKGKTILQEMCQKGIDWDEPISDSLKPEWEKWVQDLQNLHLIEIPRPLKPKDFNKVDRIELHHFSDASSTGYRQCSYVRYIHENEAHCTLVMSKSRVAPKNIVTIPRLELTAAVLSAKMSLFLREELDLQIDQEYFWTDSRVVLGYINNDARRFHVFVANRVQMIRDVTEPNQWFYVKTENNPADHASRGLTASGIMSSTWLTGPSFLWEDEIKTNQVDTQLQLGDPEVRTVRSLCTKSSVHPSILDRFNRFSSWSKLVSVIARLQRLSNGVKGIHSSTVEERLSAERKILTLVQRETFSKTINMLENSVTIPKTNTLYPLDPIQQNGLLCVGGRLRKAEQFSSQYRHPVILPKENHVTKLILRHAHQKVWHQGRGITLNKLRTSGYWILGGSKAVASMIRQCVVCRKLRRPTETQRMADLPEERVVPSAPFTFCGMDCFGPFLVKLGRREVKRYGLLLTCMCTRAIHIEMLDDMTTDAFINGLRCFIAIRGAVRQIRSDQGTNFVGAKNEFEKETFMNKVKTVLAEQQCEFIMNAPCASHTGGVWERQIKTVRNILNSVLLLCPGRLDDSSLRTIFYEVMSIVNSRPLAISEMNDPNGLEPLTPNHILTAKSDVPHPPPCDFVKQDLLLRKRWRRVQYLLQQFWSRWKKEYISQIALRQKWLEPRRNMCVGDIVLVKDLNLSRNQWPLARVVEAKADDDDLVRRVKVKLGSKSSASSATLERSVHKVVLLLEQ